MVSSSGARRMGRRDFMARFLGNSMLAVGGSLFGVAAAYELYSRQAESGLAGLRRGSYHPDVAAQEVSAVAPTASVAATVDAAGTLSPEVAAATATSGDSVPGAEPPLFVADHPAQQAPDVTPAMLPVKLSIPSIGLTGARVVEVGTRIDKGQLVWETADHAVGHNIGSAVPGQAGNMILSGHISSPVRGEGNIFHNLPTLADKIGSRASIQAGDGSWHHYDIVATDVVSPADTGVLEPTQSPVLTLLTCVPDGVYTHRFVAIGTSAGKTLG